MAYFSATFSPESKIYRNSQCHIMNHTKASHLRNVNQHMFGIFTWKMTKKINPL